MTTTSLGYSLDPPEHLPECEDDPSDECICDKLSETCWGCGRVVSACGCP